MERNLKRDLKLIVDHDAGDNPAGPKSMEELHQLPLFGLSLGSFLQVIAMEQQTCMLEVYRSAEDWGRFYFIKGSLYNAEYSGLEGEEAAMRMALWENVRLNLKMIADPNDIPRKVTKNLMSLLMESSRLRDETEGSPHGDDADDEISEEQLEILKIEHCLGILRKDMGEALLTACVTRADSPDPLTVYHASPQAVKMFEVLTGCFEIFARELDGGGLGDFFVIDLKESRSLVVILVNQYRWGIVFNHDQCALGLFRKIIMPKVAGSLSDFDLQRKR